MEQKEMTKEEIYLDYAATTHLDPRVQEYVKFFLDKHYANAGSLHDLGREVKTILSESRKRVAKVINAKSEEIIFTSGGTESINLAIKGVALCKKKGHLITSKIEHPAVLETCRYLERNGFSVTYLDVDKFGLVSLQDIKKVIQKRKDTILISIMYANNEIGTIQPIKEIGKLARTHKILFHTDACQSAGVLDLNVEKLNVDLMTLNGSKIYGPKGSGVLYKRSDVEIEPIIHGGGQEFGLRSGTENIPAIVGFTKALEIADKAKTKENKKLILLRDYFIKKILKEIPYTHLNGHPKKRLPNNVNLAFKNVEGESILLYLNESGIFVSTGSACSSNSLEISHVLSALGLKHEWAHGSIRFTLGKSTTKKKLNFVIKELKVIIGNLRRISPLYLQKEIKKKVLVVRKVGGKKR